MVRTLLGAALAAAILVVARSGRITAPNRRPR